MDRVIRRPVRGFDERRPAPSTCSGRPAPSPAAGGRPHPRQREAGSEHRQREAGSDQSRQPPTRRSKQWAAADDWPTPRLFRRWPKQRHFRPPNGTLSTNVYTHRVRTGSRAEPGRIGIPASGRLVCFVDGDSGQLLGVRSCGHQSRSAERSWLVAAVMATHVMGLKSRYGDTPSQDRGIVSCPAARRLVPATGPLVVRRRSAAPASLAGPRAARRCRAPGNEDVGRSSPICVVPDGTGLTNVCAYQADHRAKGHLLLLHHGRKQQKVTSCADLERGPTGGAKRATSRAKPKPKPKPRRSLRGHGSSGQRTH
jgi:hypothetical protein